MGMRGIIFGILSGAAALATAVFMSGAIEDGRVALTEKSEKDLASNRSAEDKETVDTYKSLMLASKNLAEREQAAINDEMSKYKSSIGYNEKMSNIANRVGKEVSEYKKSIGYDELADTYRNSYSESLAQWKADHEYNSRISKLEDKISEIKRVAKNQKSMTSFVSYNSDYAKESADKLSDTIDSNRDEAIKETKAKIKEIEDEFKEFKRVAKKELDSKIKDLQTKVDDYRDELVKEVSSEKVELNKLVESHRNEVTLNVQALRTNEEKLYDSKIKLYSEKYQDIVDKESEKVKGVIDKYTNADYIAEYLRANHYSPVTFCLIASLPALPVFAIGYYYISWVVSIVRAMKEI